MPLMNSEALIPCCKSLDRSITENKEKKSDASIDESAQAERQSTETGHWKNLYEAC